MKNRFLCVAMAAVMVGGITGCGDKEKDVDKITEKDIEDAFDEIDGEDESSKSKKSESNEIDPFEDLIVEFEGTAPYTSTVKCSGGNSAVEYTPSVSTGIQNGDVITITAEVNAYQSDEYELTETEKEYTVEGLPSYVMSLDEIPEETYGKMNSQANDAITAYGAGFAEGNSIDSYEMLGFYMLTAKSSDSGYYSGNLNEIYLVYKINTTVTGLKRDGDGETQETANETFYTYYKFNNIMTLSDGTCSVDLSSGELCDNYIESDYGYWDLIACFYNYQGYKDLDTMFNQCVVVNVENYNYETTVE